MNRTAIGIGAAVILACGIAGAQTSIFQIVQGKATVDGILSAGEWDQANWIPMDKIYAEVGIVTHMDLTNAAWAAMWDPSENVIYVAVTGTDTDHVMHAYSSWDGQDGLELYINARNDDVAGYEGMTTNKFDYAQHYLVGYDAASTSLWSSLGGNPLPSNTLPAVAFGLVTNRVVYEFKLRPFDHYDYDNVSNSTEVRLQHRLVIGLDVVLSSKMTDDSFVMLCENQNGGKFTNAGAFRDYKLIRHPPGSLLIIP